MVSIVNVTGSFLRGPVVCEVSWVKSQMSMSSISLLELTSKISSITFVMMECS